MRAHPRPWLRFGAFLTLPWACVGGPAPGAPDAGDGASELARASRMLDAGDFAGATARLERLAASCRSGDDGRRAVLLLATTALDPRNPAASPDRGAGLAARYLTLPGIDAPRRAAAETLFLLALGAGGRVPGFLSAVDTAAQADTSSMSSPGDSGAVPVLMADAAGPPLPPVASRFRRCGRGPVPVAAVDTAVLPVLPDSVYRRLPALQRDSLAVRVATLEAELDRIRRLLRDGLLPDTSDPGGWP